MSTLSRHSYVHPVRTNALNLGLKSASFPKCSPCMKLQRGGSHVKEVAVSRISTANMPMHDFEFFWLDFIVGTTKNSAKHKTPRCQKCSKDKVTFMFGLGSLGPQNNEKWRFWTPNIWVITPKNEGFGFPWLILVLLLWGWMSAGASWIVSWRLRSFIISPS